MRALVFDDIEALSVREVPDARVEAPGDAVVRVTATAICGSDLHFYHGKAPLSPGDTLGHEAVGVVQETGPDVERFREGDRVVVAFNIVCGNCWFCLHQENALCEEFRNLGAGPFGGDLGGCQAELVRVPYADTNLLALPPDIEDERALFVGDALTTGYYGAAIAGIRPGDTVAVVGAGPVGFFCIQAAMAFDPEVVLAVDLEPERLVLAEKMGAAAVNPRERSPQMAVSERTGGRGADVVIEAVGTPAAYETAIDVVRRGGAVSVLGMFVTETIEIPMGVYWARALRLTFAGLCPVHAWWQRSLEAVRSGAIDPIPVISHRLPLSQAPEGYALFDARRATKVVLYP